MKIAIIVGHDIKEQGAYSVPLKKSEYNYNNEVANNLKDVADIYYRSKNGGYKSKMQELANAINPKGYDLVVELHFNSFNGSANGCESVGFKGSVLGEKYGKVYCETISKNYNSVNRGHKVTSEKGRGYWFTKLMNPPALILEPFFGDNQEALKFNDPSKYACYLKEWLLKIQK